MRKEMASPAAERDRCDPLPNGWIGTASRERRR
jgi:hypothetical protein